MSDFYHAATKLISVSRLHRESYDDMEYQIYMNYEINFHFFLCVSEFPQKNYEIDFDLFCDNLISVNSKFILRISFYYFLLYF